MLAAGAGGEAWAIGGREVYNCWPMLGKTVIPKTVIAVGLLLAAGAWALPADAAPRSSTKGSTKKAKYYFKVMGVESTVASEEVKATAKELLEKDLASRPQFTSDVPGGDDLQALGDELRRRKLNGFLVTLRIEELTRTPQPPREGRQLKQLSLRLKLSIFATSIPESKLAFGGEGEAEVVAEVVERRMEEEATALTKDALVQAVKQAVDQAVGKLSRPVSKPFNESKRRPRGKTP